MFIPGKSVPKSLRKASTFILILFNYYALGETPGFYKDIFVDAGVGLGKLPVLPAAISLGLSGEYIATEDTVIQNEVMIINEYDKNGVLLYPDGKPRFRLLHCCGGSAIAHGSTLGETGRDRIRNFYYHGGSYTGTCAGSAIFSISRKSVGKREEYYQIWPGRIQGVATGDAYFDHQIPLNSPILRYHHFGKDLRIDNIYFNMGNYAREDLDFPQNTEVLLRYDTPGLELHEKISCWSYKESNLTGRGVVIGCHPEFEESGEKFQLMKAMMLYALDGSGDIELKGNLIKGIKREMNKATEDNDPPFTKIGDKQIHHFKVKLCQSVKNFQIKLDGEEGFDMNLYLHKGYFAFANQFDYFNNSKGTDKTITVPELDAGEWYIGVECATTVLTTENPERCVYIKNLEVLNGIAYNITVDWETIDNVLTQDLYPDRFKLDQNFPNPFNTSTLINFYSPSNQFSSLKIYNIRGHFIITLVESDFKMGTHQITWNGIDFLGNHVPSGFYSCVLKTPIEQQTIKLNLIR